MANHSHASAHQFGAALSVSASDGPLPVGRDTAEIPETSVDPDAHLFDEAVEADNGWKCTDCQTTLDSEGRCWACEDADGDDDAHLDGFYRTFGGFGGQE